MKNQPMCMTAPGSHGDAKTTLHLDTLVRKNRVRNLTTSMGKEYRYKVGDRVICSDVLIIGKFIF